MDVCFGLFILGFVLCVIAAIGHAIWLVLTAAIRAMAGGRPGVPDRPAPNRPDRQRCPRCGTHYPGGLRHCPGCRLATGGPLAQDLSNLESFAQILQSLRENGTLDEALAEQIYQRIEARQAQLLRPREKPSVEKPAALAEVEPKAAPV